MRKKGSYIDSAYYFIVNLLMSQTGLSLILPVLLHGSFVGWRVQNDGKMLMQAIAKCESCSNFDLSYNGLGDKEGEELGKALTKNYRWCT
jgi:Ran GTPase-activating protein (RanGAP) involved in mRNA processing and transport